MAIEIVSFPIKNGGSFHSYVSHYQRVTTLFTTGRGPKPSVPTGPATSPAPEPRTWHHSETSMGFSLTLPPSIEKASVEPACGFEAPNGQPNHAYL